jgi:hypothetical protein
MTGFGRRRVAGGEGGAAGGAGFVVGSSAVAAGGGAFEAALFAADCSDGIGGMVGSTTAGEELPPALVDVLPPIAEPIPPSTTNTPTMARTAVRILWRATQDRFGGSGGGGGGKPPYGWPAGGGG